MSDSALSASPAARAAVRQTVIDWLDDNYHFGDAARLIQSDEQSLLQSGVLDSLGFVQLVLFLETTYAIRIDRKQLSPATFDALGKIVAFVTSHRDFAASAR